MSIITRGIYIRGFIMFGYLKQDITKIQKKLSKKLSESRYQHSLGVAYTAASLAMRYEADMEKALLAGMLHDCAKYMTPDEMLKMALNKKIEISEVERMKPDLLHAKLGSYFAIKKYHVKDKEINEAIICHTTGKPDMTLLEKIIYVADYIEPSRYKMPRLKELRKMAFVDIDKCLIMILEDTVKYLEESGLYIDDNTKKTYDFYKK